MSESDDEIQKMATNGPNELPGCTPSGEQEDLILYSRLFDELKKEPEVKLTYGFSANVIRKIKYQKQRQSEMKLSLLVAGLISMGFLGFANSVYFEKTITALPGNKWTIFAGLLLLATIEFLDQKLVKERRIRKQ